MANQMREVMIMPTKQIYVKEADLPVYAKAEKYGTSLANVVVEALREYVKRQEEQLDADGFAQIDLEVGRYLPAPQETTVKRFWGKQIAFFEEHNDSAIPEEFGSVTCSVYLTRKGKFVLWQRSIQMGWDDENGTWNEDEIGEEASLQILDELPTVPNGGGYFELNNMCIPYDLIRQARSAISGNKIAYVEDLDV